VLVQLIEVIALPSVIPVAMVLVSEVSAGRNDCPTAVTAFKKIGSLLVAMICL
jgi:hypothetical protein